jgi:hypothetical protein
VADITLHLYADVTSRKLVGRDGGSAELPTLILGDSLPCTLAIFERVGSELREVTPHIRTMRVSLGPTLEPPASGAFTLTSGANTSAAIAFNASADQFYSALVATVIPTISTVQAPAPSCWLFRTAAGTQVAFSGAAETLSPTSFVRTRAVQRGAVWWHEVRLIQSPLAFSGLHEHVLPPAPSVTRIQAGGSDTEYVTINEIQAIHIPPEFLANDGGYVVKFDGRQTTVLGPTDGPEELATALNAMWPDTKTRFRVTLAIADTPHVEFIGELGNAGQPLMTTEVKVHGPGDLTFTLDLATAELAAALRTVPEIEVPLEIELELVAAGEDPEDPEVPGIILTLCQAMVTITREGIWPELATIPAIDWLRPPQPRSYTPFAPGQIITGSQHYTATFGDGVLRSFSFPHALGTAALHATVRENAANGKVLVHGVDYTIQMGSEAAQELILDIPTGEPTPAANSLAITLSTAGPASAFVQHNHEIGEIVGLQALLDTLTQRVTVIEDLLPSVAPMTTREDATSIDIALPDRAELFPGRFPADFDVPDDGDIDPGDLPRPPGLLPALHDATVDELVVPLPTASLHNGEVAQNNTGGDVVLPGSMGRRSSVLIEAGLAACDGRAWYRVTRDATTNSYFPTDFERELFMIHINESMLVAGTEFSFSAELSAKLFAATTRAQMLLVLEIGDALSQATPAPTGINLQDIAWQSTPLLSQRIILSEVLLTHPFGCSVRRAADGTISGADKLLYRTWTAAGIVPATANFALRARLIQFDTENSATGARGFVYYSLTEGTASFS